MQTALSNRYNINTVWIIIRYVRGTVTAERLVELPVTFPSTKIIIRKQTTKLTKATLPRWNESGQLMVSTIILAITYLLTSPSIPNILRNKKEADVIFCHGRKRNLTLTSILLIVTKKVVELYSHWKG